MAMYLPQSICLLSLSLLVAAEKCDHTPKLATNPEPSLNTFFGITVQNKGVDANGVYKPEQRYVITLYSKDSARMFSDFMITVEDPGVDDSNYEFVNRPADVGLLKILDNDLKTIYSDCLNTVQNIDNSAKDMIQVHWLSPKNSATSTVKIAENVRIRAMIAENREAWYVEPGLTEVLTLDDTKPLDSPPMDAKEECNLCSEARYEVIFQGQWSQLTHPRHFPTKPDNNAYTHMVGASHGFQFNLWEPGTKASPGLQLTAEEANTTVLEDEIISAISSTEKTGTRTLIRGPKNAYRDMFKPSHALFRVDPRHHLFSVVIGIQPSPDWFLGAYNFELCSDEEWLKTYTLPLYPWDSGTMDGVSYDTPRKMSNPPELVGRVALGSFDLDSPFYQINLNDLKPFGFLTVNLLNVYQLQDSDCENKAAANDDDAGEKNEESEEAANQEEEPEEDEPEPSEFRAGCGFGPWGAWYPCKPDDDDCGPGKQTRVRLGMTWNPNYRFDMNSPSSQEAEACIEDTNKIDTESKDCYVECY